VLYKLLQYVYFNHFNLIATRAVDIVVVVVVVVAAAAAVVVVVNVSAAVLAVTGGQTLK